MHRNRRPAAIAVLSLVSLMAALALSLAQNVELRAGSSEDGIARMGIEGEGDLPLPVAEQV